MYGDGHKIFFVVSFLNSLRLCYVVVRLFRNHGQQLFHNAKRNCSGTTVISAPAFAADEVESLWPPVGAQGAHLVRVVRPRFLDAVVVFNGALLVMAVEVEEEA